MLLTLVQVVSFNYLFVIINNNFTDTTFIFIFYLIIVCKTGSDYLPNHEYEGVTCADRAQHFKITSSVQCTADPGTKEPNQCHGPNGGTNADCQSANGKDAATCAAATTSGGGGVAANACVFQTGQDTRGMKHYTNELARIGCCGSAKKSACWEDISASGKL